MVSNKNILLLSHHNDLPGMANQLINYFSKHFCFVGSILHPLNPKSPTKSIVSFGKKNISLKIPWFAQFFLEGIVGFYYLYYLKKNIVYDIAICLDPLSFLHTYLWKKIFSIKKIIYYNVDYSTKRFNNYLLNQIYLKINIFAYQKCDYFFYITKNFIKDIDRQNKHTEKAFRIRHIVQINKNKKVKKLENSIVFAGNISYGTDFQNLIKALGNINKSGLDFIFDIYGIGDAQRELTSLINRYGIKHRVFLKGIVDNDKLINEVLPKYRIGVAPYIAKENFSKSVANHVFAGEDLSTKIVEYLGCGLPVITTRPYPAFDAIINKKLGFLVSKENEWRLAIRRLLTDKNIWNKYSKNAFNYAHLYDPDKILKPILDKILGNIND